jgi:Probable sensor domain DACNV
MQKFIVRHALRTTLMSLVIVLVSRGLIPHASMQDAVKGIERSHQPDTANHDDRAHEFSDATIVVRWSQLAQDNAFAVDPAMTDRFPNARGWTMMYLAMHDALNAIVPAAAHLATILSVCYHATLLRQERRPVTFRLALSEPGVFDDAAGVPERLSANVRCP